MFWNSKLAVIWKYYVFPPQAFSVFLYQCIFLHHADLGKQLTSVSTVLEWQVAKESPGWREAKGRRDHRLSYSPLLISAQQGLEWDSCAEKSSNHWCSRQASPKLRFYWIISKAGEETDASSQLGKKRLGYGSERNYECICAWLCHDAFPLHIYPEYAIYFHVYVVLDILSAWERWLSL